MNNVNENKNDLRWWDRWNNWEDALSQIEINLMMKNSKKADESVEMSKAVEAREETPTRWVIQNAVQDSIRNLFGNSFKIQTHFKLKTSKTVHRSDGGLNTTVRIEVELEGVDIRTQIA